jgi:hypothetical protein
MTRPLTTATGTSHELVVDGVIDASVTSVVVDVVEGLTVVVELDPDDEPGASGRFDRPVTATRAERVAGP